MNFEIKLITLQQHYDIAQAGYSERQNTPVFQPSGLCQYVGEEIFDKIIYAPIGAYVGDKIVGTYMSRNISKTKIYTSGQWIHHDYRGYGISKAFRKWTRDFWPPQYDTIIAYYLSSSFIKFAAATYPKTIEYPGHSWWRINSSSYPHEHTILAFTDF